MRTRLLLSSLAALCVVHSGALAADLLRSLDKTTKAADILKTTPATAALDCSGAVEVSLNNTYSGDNTGAPNNVTTYGCSVWTESGSEVVYHLRLTSPTLWLVSIAASCDLDLAVLSGCDEYSNCLIVVDQAVQTNVPVSGDFYFVVDGYHGAACPFTITFTEIPYTPANFCPYVQPLDCTSQTISGTTCGGQNLVKVPDCTGTIENGLEKYYSVTLQPGGSFGAFVTFPSVDGALYVFDACAEPFTCLAAADYTGLFGNELVSYTNSSLVPKTVYFVIDSKAQNDCGNFTCTFECRSGAVGVAPAGWGGVKTLYR